MAESIIKHITPVGANIFADLGFEPEEAATLLAASRRIIAEELALKGKAPVADHMPERELPRDVQQKSLSPENGDESVLHKERT